MKIPKIIHKQMGNKKPKHDINSEINAYHNQRITETERSERLTLITI